MTAVQAFTSLPAVDPVPWARSQMAFTLGVHIILVPLGVAWAFMMLVANHRAIRRNDTHALRLAQRWSKVMAVTFAVGAITGTVLTFEFGLLWPRFMGRFGGPYGIPFAIEGIFFFVEAIFTPSTCTDGGAWPHGRISGQACRS
ncbi:MAG TPA: cytochrome ubiquinol oxidase subunit I [Candidatus Dormibacteraeota bacterium]